MKKKMEFEGVSDVDVLLGRGGGICNQPGNIRYRQIIFNHRAAYAKAKKHLKLQIAKSCVQMVVNAGGRFLDWDSESKSWAPVKELRPVEKTSQALRENAKDSARVQKEAEPKTERVVRRHVDQKKKVEQDNRARQFSSVAHLETLHGIPISFDVLKKKQQQEIQDKEEEEQRIAQLQHQKEQKGQKLLLQQEQLTIEDGKQTAKIRPNSRVEAASQSQLQELASMLYAANQTARNNWLSQQQYASTHRHDDQGQTQPRPPSDTASLLESTEEMPGLPKDFHLNEDTKLTSSNTAKKPPEYSTTQTDSTFGSPPPSSILVNKKNPAQKSPASTFGRTDENCKAHAASHSRHLQQAASAILLSQQASVTGRVDPTTQMLAALFGKNHSMATAATARGGNTTASTNNASVESALQFINNTSSLSNTQHTLQEKSEILASMAMLKRANNTTESLGMMQSSGQDAFGGNILAVSLAQAQLAQSLHTSNEQQPQNDVKNRSNSSQIPNMSNFGAYFPRPQPKTRQHKSHDMDRGCRSPAANFAAAAAAPQQYRPSFATTPSTMSEQQMIVEARQEQEQQQQRLQNYTKAAAVATAAANSMAQAQHYTEEHQKRPITLPLTGRFSGPGLNAQQLLAGSFGVSNATTKNPRPQKDVDVGMHDFDEIRCLLTMEGAMNTNSNNQAATRNVGGGGGGVAEIDATKKAPRPLLLTNVDPNQRTKQGRWKLYRTRPRRNNPFENNS